MPGDTQKAPENKMSFMAKIFEHHQDHGQDNTSQGGNKDEAFGHQSHLRTLEKDLKKDEEGIRKYYQEDKTLEEEGKTYGGLM
ncbi:hypothetical protein NUU61_002103 [Penicillium alfredii]|uniref:Uncharacterized protein n=1 Tax=Penicillium alfredii TaxID=1506179 RepID=A0A9W9FQX0_9EURO|nr:uncharacterized protein NUU61_002103 [Penicillium alfredii]KAJ5104756.1 hypothetical protein NUU61_002103 [Penicillium alfredii]